MIGILVIGIISITVLLKEGPEEESIARGEVLYNKSCIQCHGENGQGREVGNATSLNNQEFLNVASDEFLIETITKGRSGTQMPGFGDQFSNDEIKDIVHFIKAWRTEEIDMPTPNTISGDPNLGRKIYLANCASCHGITASGELTNGPSLINQDFLEAATEEFIWDTTAYGRSNTPMGPSLKGLDGIRQLTEKEISALVVYLKSNKQEKDKE